MKQATDDFPIEKLLKVKDVAEILQVSTSWLYKMVEAGEFPHVRLGASVRFRPDDVRAFMRGEWSPVHTATTVLAAKRAK